MVSNLENSLIRSGTRRYDWENLLASTSGLSQDYLTYLLTYMPQDDLASLPTNLLLENVKYAELVRHETPCSMVVPEDIFNNYVLPYACLDETRISWRPFFYEQFQELARRSASIEDAVLTLNRLAFDQLEVEYHPTKRPHNNMNHKESMACGYASCTGLAILMVSACRAVGIPARIAGIPSWPDGTGNHNWFEVWDFGEWHFLGASEPGEYDLTWFNDKVRSLDPDPPQENRIYATRYDTDNVYFPLAWDAESHAINAIDRTSFYQAVAPRPKNPTDIVIRPRGYICGRTPHPIKITGRLDDPAWKAAPWTEYFVDIEGHHKPTPRFHTRAKMLWDDDYLYVGAYLEEPHVWGTLKDKNSIIFNDPDFEIFIDPDGSNHNYYEFEINALGTIWELSLERPYRDGGPIHRGDNMPGLLSKVHIDGSLNDPSDTDKGWSIEVAIPWSGLARYTGKNQSCPPQPGNQWRMNMSRVNWLVDIIDGKYSKVPREAHPEDNWVWTPQRAIDMHRPEQWGYVQFANGAASETEFVPDPTWAARERLMEIYYLQKERSKPTINPDDLNLKGIPDKSISAPPVLKLGDNGAWTATYEVVVENGITRWVSVDEHGLLDIKLTE